MVSVVAAQRRRTHVCRRWIAAPDFTLIESGPATGHAERATGQSGGAGVFSRSVQLGLHEGAVHVPRSAARLNDAQAQVYGISVDTFFALKAFHDAQQLTFPLLSDFNKQVIRDYGVFNEDMIGLKGIAKRAVFVHRQGRHCPAPRSARGCPERARLRQGVRRAEGHVISWNRGRSRSEVVGVDPRVRPCRSSGLSSASSPSNTYHEHMSTCSDIQRTATASCSRQLLVDGALPRRSRCSGTPRACGSSTRSPARELCVGDIAAAARPQRIGRLAPAAAAARDAARPSAPRRPDDLLHARRSPHRPAVRAGARARAGAQGSASW